MKTSASTGDKDEFPNSSSRLLMCSKPMQGRYVSIQRMDGFLKGAMVLCEVVVWATLGSGL